MNTENLKLSLNNEIERLENEVENEVENESEKKYTTLEVLALLYSIRDC